MNCVLDCVLHSPVDMSIIVSHCLWDIISCETVHMFNSLPNAELMGHLHEEIIGT